MTYINLPCFNYNNLLFNIVLQNNKSKEEIERYTKIQISESLYFYLNKIKKNITVYNKFWDVFKKITNPYEYIHTIIPNNKVAICKYKPISRSFFKLIEIINAFNFLDESYPIKSFHLAEGPGGFIEAFNYIRNNKNDYYYGITLISSDNNIPSWKKSQNILNNNKNIIIEKVTTKT